MNSPFLAREIKKEKERYQHNALHKFALHGFNI